MKITYPEFQLEISVDELIELNDHYETQIQCLPPELPGLKPVDFKHFGLTEEAKEWLEETLKENIKKINEQMLAATDPARRGAGLVPHIKEDPKPVPYPQDEEYQAPTYEPGGIVGNGESEPSGEKVVRLPKEMQRAIVEKTPYVGKKKPSGKAKKVDVLFDTGWKTFRTMGAAAKAIDARLNHLSHALLTGKPCKGHQVRYSTDGQEQPKPSSEKSEDNP